MLAFRYRFHGHGSLNFVYRKGRTAKAQHFFVRTTRNKMRQDCRFAVVVSKKTHKSAVGRNRMRRRVYEIVRGELPKIPLTHDVIINIHSAEVMSLPFDELKGELQQLFTRLGLYYR